MNWFQKIASEDIYDEMVFKYLRRHSLFSAIEALKEHGPHGLDLWIKFKDGFDRNPRLLSDWILKSTAPVVPQYESMDEIDNWAAKAHGINNRETGRVPRSDFTIDERGTGGMGTNKSRNSNRAF